MAGWWAPRTLRAARGGLPTGSIVGALEDSRPTRRHNGSVSTQTPAMPGSPLHGPRLRSPFARAVVPVVGGMAVIAAIFGATWLVAMRVDQPTALAPSTFTVGSVEARAQSIADDGPILLPGLDTTTGERTIVLNHTGDDPTAGWKLFWAYPADRDDTCGVEQIRGTSGFTDCDGRRIDVTDLAPAAGALPIVENSETLTIDLREATKTT